MASLVRVLTLVSFCSFVSIFGCGKGPGSANVSDAAGNSSISSGDEYIESSAQGGDEDASDLEWDESATDGGLSVPGGDLGFDKTIAPPTGFGPDDVRLFGEDLTEDPGTDTAEGTAVPFSLDIIEDLEPSTDNPSTATP